jgi:hypothetical protein
MYSVANRSTVDIASAATTLSIGAPKTFAHDHTVIAVRVSAARRIQVVCHEGRLIGRGRCCGDPDKLQLRRIGFGDHPVNSEACPPCECPHTA